MAREREREREREEYIFRDNWRHWHAFSITLLWRPFLIYTGTGTRDAAWTLVTSTWSFISVELWVVFALWSLVFRAASVSALVWQVSWMDRIAAFQLHDQLERSVRSRGLCVIRRPVCCVLFAIYIWVMRDIRVKCCTINGQVHPLGHWVAGTKRVPGEDGLIDHECNEKRKWKFLPTHFIATLPPWRHRYTQCKTHWMPHSMPRSMLFPVTSILSGETPMQETTCATSIFPFPLKILFLPASLANTLFPHPTANSPIDTEQSGPSTIAASRKLARPRRSFAVDDAAVLQLLHLQHPSTSHMLQCTQYTAHGPSRPHRPRTGWSSVSLLLTPYTHQRCNSIS